MRDLGKPDSWITWQVRTEGLVRRQVDLPGEARHVLLEGAGKRGTSGTARPSDASGRQTKP